jgi:cytochrome c-type biogenesis protein CcmE
MRKRRLKIMITAAIAVLGVGAIAYSSLGAAEYYDHVDKVVADPGPWLARKSIKVHGFVVPGSIKKELRRDEDMTYRTFLLESGGQRVEVRHRGTVPDNFKDQAETVVTGRLVEENGKLVLLAHDGENAISAKCPSKYEASRKR